MFTPYYQIYGGVKLLNSLADVTIHASLSGTARVGLFTHSSSKNFQLTLPRIPQW